MTPQKETAREPRKPLSSESAWLIERCGLCLGRCENRFSWVTFTNEDALRFSREVDAYNFLDCIDDMWSKSAWDQMHNPRPKITQHSWPTAAEVSK